ncbi:hypothetical protein ASD21_11350 [Caulobacter sp. Root1455]|uniref:hypothetical protein n=1 Tax=unclassified Caulobacter TaxID=2648921 RepID=UPI0006FA856F|nr:MULTISPECIES: hypothetical protein [unclassified Caulobacter]KQY35373.1 hypothetical protein ASD38_02080 [Caulobacter sp. Root487D2Y]KQY93351.1 hypothetical protein ASD21_11350 [Caulobacter sp. Root1455]
MVRRLLPLLVLAAACAAWGGASAEERPGECVTRRVTGPGGAYRYDRVECEVQAGWSDFDRWGYQRPLDVVDAPLRGDRYGGWSQVAPDHGYRGHEERPSQDDRLEDDRLGARHLTYRVAGRDADGFLVWPGKSP